MKKNRIFAIVAALAIVISSVVVFQACRKSEPTYSCDPEINKWTAQNRDSFHNITREQLALLPISVQNAIYRTLTTEEQRKLWVEKMDIVKNEWPKPIKNKVDELTEIVHLYNPDLYGKIDDKIKKSLDNWENEMLLHHMDTVDYALCFYTLETAEEYDLLTNNPEKIDYSWFDFPENFNLGQKAAPGPNGSNDCVCRGSIGIACGGGDRCEEDKDDCSHTKGGCGLFKLFDCTGLCASWPTTSSSHNIQY